MSDVGMTTSQVGGAGAYARAATLGPAIPVRAIDPARQRFQVKDSPGRDGVAAPPVKDNATDQAGGQSDALASGGDSGQGSRGGFALLGAFTSFLARLFAQPEPVTEPNSATMQAGAQAYARSAGPLPANENGMEVMSPTFPALASGRAVDLSV